MTLTPIGSSRDNNSVNQESFIEVHAPPGMIVVVYNKAAAVAVVRTEVTVVTLYWWIVAVDGSLIGRLVESDVNLVLLKGYNKKFCFKLFVI